MISLAEGEFPYNGRNRANRGHAAWNNQTLAGMAATTARRTGYEDAVLLVVAMKDLASDRAKIRHDRPAPYRRFGWNAGHPLNHRAYPHQTVPSAGLN
jgi:hypothetical protein